MSSENKLLVNDGMDDLTALIVETLILQRQEECYPCSDSDRKIAACKKRVILLRNLREQFEDEISRPL